MRSLKIIENPHFYVFGGFSMNVYQIKGIYDIFLFFTSLAAGVSAEIYIRTKKHVYDAKYVICANLPYI